MQPATSDPKRRLLVISHVLPYPGDSGQQMRVANVLKALREHFAVDVLTFAAAAEVGAVANELSRWCDRPMVLRSRALGGIGRRGVHWIASLFYRAYTGLKMSNYLLNREFSPKRILGVCDPRAYDVVLLELWHAAAAAIPVFAQRGIPCVLDMHDIFANSYAPYLRRVRAPQWWKDRALARYTRAEQRAWSQFTAIVALNRAEADDVRRRFDERIPVFYAPLGVDMEEWRWVREPARPMRVAYYGALRSSSSTADALACFERVMPRLWQVQPAAEFWILGSHPSRALKLLERDRRVHVPGFVADIKPLLGATSLLLCPFTAGRFGFRSRLVEAMALGVPVVASEDAVYGMGFADGHGIFITSSMDEMTGTAARLVERPDELQKQRAAAREQVVRSYGFDATYGAMARMLRELAETRPVVPIRTATAFRER